MNLYNSEELEEAIEDKDTMGFVMVPLIRQWAKFDILFGLNPDKMYLVEHRKVSDGTTGGKARYHLRKFTDGTTESHNATSSYYKYHLKR